MVLGPGGTGTGCGFGECATQPAASGAWRGPASRGPKTNMVVIEVIYDGRNPMRQITCLRNMSFEVGTLRYRHSLGPRMERSP